jgi:hypothetical protein
MYNIHIYTIYGQYACESGILYYYYYYYYYLRARSGRHTWHLLTYADVCSRVRTPARSRLQSCHTWRMLTYADVCWRMLTRVDARAKWAAQPSYVTYADVCWHMLTYAHACRRPREVGSSHTSSYPLSSYQLVDLSRIAGDGLCSIRQHTPASYVSIRQHTSAYVSIREHTWAYVSVREHTSA